MSEQVLRWSMDSHIQRVCVYQSVMVLVFSQQVTLYISKKTQKKQEVMGNDSWLDLEFYVCMRSYKQQWRVSRRKGVELWGTEKKSSQVMEVWKEPGMCENRGNVPSEDHFADAHT